jgi:hypothetical protein
VDVLGVGDRAVGEHLDELAAGEVVAHVVVAEAA